MKTVTIKTCELEGNALDYAVAKVKGLTDEWRNDGPFLWNGTPCIREYGHDMEYHPSIDWGYAGPIIAENCIITTFDRTYDFDQPWRCALSIDPYNLYEGKTPIIAAMRCYVASKLGDSVTLPESLFKR